MIRLRLLLALTALCTACSATRAPADGTSVPAPATAQEAPTGEGALTLQLPKFPGGELHDFASDRGHVVLLDFWATYCEPCRDSLPTYQTFLEKYGAQGLRVYAVSVDEDRNQVAGFIEKFGLQLPVLMDPEAAASEGTLRVRALPTTFVLDRQGRVRAVHEGWNEDSREAYELELQGLLAEREGTN